MTTRAKSCPSQEAREQLATRIEEELARAPCSVMQLVDKLGFSHYSIRTRLSAMLEEDTAHFVTMRTCGGIGLTYVWHSGPAPDDQAAPRLRCIAPSVPV